MISNDYLYNNLLEHTEIIDSCGDKVNLFGSSLRQLLSAFNSFNLGKEPIHSGSATNLFPEIDKISKLCIWFISIKIM